MKQLELRKTPKGKSFLYEVIEDGNILCSRTTSDSYIACAVLQIKPTPEVPRRTYKAPYFFSRKELIFHGRSGFVKDAAYALATLQTS